MIVQLIFNGLVMGAIYATVAFGMVMIYRTLGMMNFFHGSMYMLGALFGYELYVVYKIPAFIAFPLSLICVGLIGAFLERVILRRLAEGIKTRIIVGTVILGNSILNNLALIVLGPYPVRFTPYLPENNIVWGNIIFQYQQILIASVSLILGLVLFLFMKFTKTGKAFRAMSGNLKAAQLMGVNTSSMRTLSFGVASALGALAGLLIAPQYIVSSTMGDSVILKAFVVAVFGGLNSMIGAIVGGIVIGVIDSLSGFYIGSTYTDLWSFLIMAIMLLYKPQGLFGNNKMEKV
jgi:branched-chain amino acid transport system permease protein